MRVFKPSSTAGAVMLAVAGLAVAPSAQAVVVYSGPLNLAVPNTSAGLYVNVIDGTSYSGPSTFPSLGGPGANFDINAFGTTTWSLFSPSTSGQSLPTPVPTTSKGYVAATTTGAASNLALGTLIDGSSTFNTGTVAGTSISTGQPVIVGFRFRNEGPDLSVATDDTVHYGWARFVLTAGTPGRLVDYAYESTPLMGIQAGAVPEPAAWLMMGLGLAALALRRRRAAP